MPAEQKKVANYRRCFITDGQGNDASAGQTLQGLIHQAAGAIARPWLRPLGAGETSHQLLTYLMNKNGCVCGELVYYEKGKKIPLVDINADGTTWQAAIPPTDAQGTARKFQEGALYFSVRENHMAVIHSATLNSDRLQEFLSWLIQSKANLAPMTFIAIENLPAKSALDKLKDHNIKAIKFGENLFTKVKTEKPPIDGEKPTKRKRYVQTIETNPRLLGILIELGLPQPLIEKVAKSPDPGSIQVDVEIKYKSRSEKEGSKVLQSIASTLGKQEGLDTEIKLDGNSSIRGDELTVRGNVAIQCPDGLIAMDDALSKLSQWLMLQIQDGKVV